MTKKTLVPEGMQAPADILDHEASDLLAGLPNEVMERKDVTSNLQQIIEDQAVYIDYDDESERPTEIASVHNMNFVDLMTERYQIVASPMHIKPMMYDPNEQYWKQLDTVNLGETLYWQMLAPTLKCFENSYLYTSNKAMKLFQAAAKEWSGYVRQKANPALIDVTDPHYIQFNNGVYNFLTDELEAPTPEHNQTVKMTYDLIKTDEKTEAEEWLEFLVGDAVTSLMELIGYCFYRDYNYAAISFFVNGKGITNGKNGKSQVLNFINEVLSQNASSIPLNAFDGKDKFALANLYTQLANLAGDAPDIYFDSMDALKSASGNDELTAEFKGKDKFQFKNYAKLFFATNFLPRVKDTSSAVRERILLVPFIRDLGTDENMKTLREKFNPNRKKRVSPEELGKFAYRAIQAFHKVLERDEALRSKAFSLTQEQLDMLEGYMKDNDSIAQFFEDDDCQYIPTHKLDDRVNAKEFKKAYLDWCQENNFKAYGKYFNNEMANKGFEHKAAKLEGKAQKCFLGIKMKDFTAPQQKEESPF